MKKRKKKKVKGSPERQAKAQKQRAAAPAKPAKPRWTPRRAPPATIYAVEKFKNDRGKTRFWVKGNGNTFGPYTTLIKATQHARDLNSAASMSSAPPLPTPSVLT